MNSVMNDPEDPLAVTALEGALVRRNLHVDADYEDLIFVLALYEMGGRSPYSNIDEVREEVRKFLT